MTTRLVRLHRARRSPSQSYGMIVRRSSTATLMPSFSACCAASSERCTSAPHVSTDDVGALAAHRGLAERDHVVGARVGALVVGLAVEVLVLEEQHRVVAADRRAQQPGRVDARSTGTRCGCRGSARRCSRPTGCGTARRRAGSRRSATRITIGHDEVVARAVAQHRHLVADLHHRRPDVVEELDLDDRLDAARRHADGAADDVGLGERRVEDAVAAVRALQAVRDLEDAALARHRRRAPSSRLQSATSSPKTTMRGLRAISSFSVRLMAGDHRVGLAVRLRGSVANAARRRDRRRARRRRAPPCRASASRRLERARRRRR